MRNQASAKKSLRLRLEPVPGDCAGIRAILDSNGIFYPYEVDVAVELVEDRLEREDQSDYHFIFLESDDAVVGYSCYGAIYMTDNRFDLYWIAVREDLRGKGLGRILLSETEKKIRAMKGAYLYIETSGKDDYARTRAFYQKSGYLEVACIPHFYKENDHKIIFMKKL
jgi:ribosomal protein S18 acetylase RimI-like enzyme